MTGTLIDFVYLQLMQNVGLLRMMSQQVIHQHDDVEYMGVYRVSSTLRGRCHLNDNEINFLFGANHPALGTDLLIFVYGGTLAISSEYELLSQYHYLQVTICFIKVSLCRNFFTIQCYFQLY